MKAGLVCKMNTIFRSKLNCQFLFIAVVMAAALLTYAMPVGIFAQDAPAAPAGGDAPAAPAGGDAPAAPAGGGETPAAPAGGGEAPAAPAGGESGSGEGDKKPAAAEEPEEPMKEYQAKDKSKDPKDPFKPLIAPPPPVQAPQAPTNAPVKKVEQVVPPLPLKVTFIVGSESKKIAVISLNNKTYEMAAGDQEESGLFKVLEVGDSKVKVFDSRVQKEREIVMQGM